MNNSFEQLELIISELSLDKKHLLVKLLNGQISGQSCLDVLTEHQDNASTCPHCHSQKIKRNGKLNNHLLK
jgi:Zn finger protein HypA/HybF involved in hydrogenase expression